MAKLSKRARALIMAMGTQQARASFTPTDLGAALKAWMSADAHGTANMTDDGNGLISSWTSEDGSALTVTAATTARPTWTADAISNGRGKTYAGLSFNGTANVMLTTTLTNIPTGSTAGEAWVSLNQLNSAATGGVPLRYGGTGANAARSLQKTTGLRALVGDATTNLTDTQFTFVGLHILGGAWSGTTETGRFDGRDFAPSSATISALNTGTTRLAIGATNAASPATFATIALRHLLITTTLTAVQRQKLEGWLAWDIRAEYLLPLTHPYRTYPP